MIRALAPLTKEVDLLLDAAHESIHRLTLAVESVRDLPLCLHRRCRNLELTDLVDIDSRDCRADLDRGELIRANRVQGVHQKALVLVD